MGSLFAGRKRNLAPPVCEVVGDLTETDLLDRANATVATGATLKRLRQSHHQAARLVAEGLPDAEVSMRTGYSTATIRRLKADPTFKELLESYIAREGAMYTDVRQKVADLAGDSVDELKERLTEAPESFTNGQLTEIMKLTLDRSGHGPTSTQVNVSAGLTQEDLKEFKNVEEAEIVYERTPSNSGSGKCVDAEYTTVAGTEEAEGEQSEGEDVREEGSEGSEKAGSGSVVGGAVVRL